MPLSKLTDNEWGFDVKTCNPFQIFRILQEVATESVGEEAMIDLSRGDPGQGYTPTERGRLFYGYLCCLDSYLNNSERHIKDVKREEFDEVWKEIEEYTSKHFPADYYEIMRDWRELFQRMAVISMRQKLDYSKYDIVYELFKNSALTGGMYLEPEGEKIVRAIMADSFYSFIEQKLDYEDVVFFNGASHAMGALLRGLGPEGIDYVAKGDYILTTSPTYSPYNNCLPKLGWEPLSLSVDYHNGVISEESFRQIENFDKPIKLILLVDPNNPSGFSTSEEDIHRICEIARKHNSLILSDEVYSQLFAIKKTAIDFAPERVIRIDAVSKIHVSTGLRFGLALTTKEGRKYMAENILHEKLPEGVSFQDFLINLKNPGTVFGEFKHITFVPGPSQYLGAMHTLLGNTEKEQYVAFAQKNNKIFHETLGLKNRGNAYYSLFDMNEVTGCKKQNVQAEQKLVDLAKLGVLYIPAARFFSEEDAQKHDLANLVRVSLVNDTLENLKKGAEITKDYLCS